MHQHSHSRSPRKRREREGDRNVFEETMVENFPNLKKEIENTEDSKQNESKQTHAKTYHN